MVRCNLGKLKIKLSEQDSKNIPSKYQFPTAFSQNGPSVCSPTPSHGDCTEGRLSVFVLHLKTFNIKNSLTSSLDISFTVLGREGYGKSSPESSIRGEASVLINISLFSLSDFQNSLPRPAGCLLYVSHSRPMIKQAIGEHSGFKDPVSCTGAESCVTLFVERSLISTCAVSLTARAQEPCVSTTYLSRQL